MAYLGHVLEFFSNFTCWNVSPFKRGFRLKTLFVSSYMSANTVTNNGSTAAYVVDDAVGVAKSYWFVAIVNHNTEKSASEKLEKLNIRHYLPIQTELRVWKNGRKSKVDRVVIPSTIFVYCTEQQRKEIVGLPFINRFMTNKAGTRSGVPHRPLAIIPDKQIDTLKFMVGNSDSPVTVTQSDFKHGDKVRVIRGSLLNLEGEVLDMSKDKSELIVCLDVFGCARLTIDTVNLERI